MTSNKPCVRHHYWHQMCRRRASVKQSISKAVRYKAFPSVYVPYIRNQTPRSMGSPNFIILALAWGTGPATARKHQSKSTNTSTAAADVHSQYPVPEKIQVSIIWLSVFRKTVCFQSVSLDFVVKVRPSRRLDAVCQGVKMPSPDILTGTAAFSCINTVCDGASCRL